MINVAISIHRGRITTQQCIFQIAAIFKSPFVHSTIWMAGMQLILDAHLKLLDLQIELKPLCCDCYSMCKPFIHSQWRCGSSVIYISNCWLDFIGNECTWVTKRCVKAIGIISVNKEKSCQWCSIARDLCRTRDPKPFVCPSLVDEIHWSSLTNQYTSVFVASIRMAYSDFSFS